MRTINSVVAWPRCVGVPPITVWAYAYLQPAYDYMHMQLLDHHDCDFVYRQRMRDTAKCAVFLRSSHSLPYAYNNSPHFADQSQFYAYKCAIKHTLAISWQ